MPNGHDSVSQVKIDHNYHQLPSERTQAWERTLTPDYWEYRRRWKENPEKDVVEEFPIHLDVEATSDCNLRCTMCPRTSLVDEGRFWKVQSVDFELFTDLIDAGVQRGLASLKFNYLGEPLMNRRLAEMVRYAKQAGVIDVMLNTNATLMTERHSRELIEAGLDKLFFSFDSPVREHYNRIRVNANYDKTLQNIRRFHEIRREMGSVKPFTRVAMVRMRENEGEWELFREIFEPIVDAVAYQDYLDHSSQRVSDKMIVEQAEEGLPFCCPQLWQRMFVHPDGVVTPCCVDSARSLVMGNVKEQSASEVWTGARYRELREMHRAGRISEIPTCAACTLAKLP